MFALRAASLEHSVFLGPASIFAKILLESLCARIYSMPMGILRWTSVPVAQLDRALASGAEDREFESPRAHHLSGTEYGLKVILRPAFCPLSKRVGKTYHFGWNH